MNIPEFINKSEYDNFGQMIFRLDDKGNISSQLIDLRGWASIRNSFETEEEAKSFQDKVGEFISEAINEKIDRDKIDEPLTLAYFQSKHNPAKNIVLEQEWSLRISSHTIVCVYDDDTLEIEYFADVIDDMVNEVLNIKTKKDLDDYIRLHHFLIQSHP